MMVAVLIWTGAVLAIGLVLLMAVGPAIVELDSWWYERKRRRAAATARPTGDGTADTDQELVRPTA